MSETKRAWLVFSFHVVLFIVAVIWGTPLAFRLGFMFG